MRNSNNDFDKFVRKMKARIRYLEREVAYWQHRHPVRFMHAYERLQDLCRSLPDDFFNPPKQTRDELPEME